MKYLLLILLSLNSYAQFEATLTPLDIKEQPVSIKVNSEDQIKISILDWIKRHKYFRTEWSKTDVNSIASVEEDVIAMVDDEEVISKVTMYLNPINFSITIEDKTAEEEAEETAKAERKAEMQELKTFINNVNESQLPAWHKKLLKVLIRELKD
jgi:hypothetical protein